MTLPSHSASESNVDNFFQILWPCLKGEKLAKHPEIQPLYQELESLLSAPARVYAELYETTLFRFMEFCQAMPQDMKEPKPYSLLTTALETAVAALKIRRGIMLPRHSNSETIAEQEPRWTYAVLTASLWVRLVDLQTDRMIELYENDQKKIGIWHPWAGNLYEPNTCYKILPQSHPTRVDPQACLMGCLIKIMPPIACRWLTSDQKVWFDWWEVVTHTMNTITSHNELGQLLKKVLPEGEWNAQRRAFVAMTSSLTSSSENSENGEGHSTVDLDNKKTIIGSTEATDKLELLKDKAYPTENTKHDKPTSLSNSLKAEPSTEEDNALADIQEWVLHHGSPAGKLNGKKQFLRIPSGLLIRESCLKLFIKENSEYPSVDSILNYLGRYLEQASQNVLIQYPFVQDAKEEIISGIILKNEYLCESLKSYPENQFVENGV